jgi:hypothetical protein
LFCFEGVLDSNQLFNLARPEASRGHGQQLTVQLQGQDSNVRRDLTPVNLGSNNLGSITLGSSQTMDQIANLVLSPSHQSRSLRVSNPDNGGEFFLAALLAALAAFAQFAQGQQTLIDNNNNVLRQKLPLPTTSLSPLSPATITGSSSSDINNRQVNNFYQSPMSIRPSLYDNPWTTVTPSSSIMTRRRQNAATVRFVAAEFSGVDEEEDRFEATDNNSIDRSHPREVVTVHLEGLGGAWLGRFQAYRVESEVSAGF